MTNTGRPFKRTLRKGDFGMTGTVSLTAGKFVEIGSLTVKAQQEIALGNNESVSGRIQGAPMYVNLYDNNGAQIPGLVRFVYSDANEVDSPLYLEESIERLSADISDRNKAVLYPETLDRVGRDSKIRILFKADNTATLDCDNSNTVLSIPVTVYQ